jgi:hypothetical protein
MQLSQGGAAEILQLRRVPMVLDCELGLQSIQRSVAQLYRTPHGGVVRFAFVGIDDRAGGQTVWLRWAGKCEVS